jgi:hypothetical protein
MINFYHHNLLDWCHVFLRKALLWSLPKLLSEAYSDSHDGSSVDSKGPGKSIPVPRSGGLGMHGTVPMPRLMYPLVSWSLVNKSINCRSTIVDVSLLHRSFVKKKQATSMFGRTVIDRSRTGTVLEV